MVRPNASCNEKLSLSDLLPAGAIPAHISTEKPAATKIILFDSGFDLEYRISIPFKPIAASKAYGPAVSRLVLNKITYGTAGTAVLRDD